MKQRWSAVVSVVAVVAVTQVVSMTPAHAAGGDINISVSGDLGACVDVSFYHPQLESAGAFSGVGVGTTYSNGVPTHIGGADGATAANGDPLPTMCIPGDPRVNLGEITYEAMASGIDYRGLATVLSITMECVYTNLGSVLCSPPVKVRLPIGAV
jgi:hypothetical protein